MWDGDGHRWDVEGLVGWVRFRGSAQVITFDARQIITGIELYLAYHIYIYIYIWWEYFIKLAYMHTSNVSIRRIRMTSNPNHSNYNANTSEDHCICICICICNVSTPGCVVQILSPRPLWGSTCIIHVNIYIYIYIMSWAIRVLETNILRVLVK